MINIHCYKTFQNYYKIETKPILTTNKNTVWTVQKFKADGVSCATFIHHRTLFYITLFDLKRDSFENLKEYFFEGIIRHLEKYKTLNSIDVENIKSYCGELNFLEKSTENKVNFMLSNIIGVIKGLDLWMDFENENPISIKETYEDFEQFFNIRDCENFLESIKQ